MTYTRHIFHKTDAGHFPQSITITNSHLLQVEQAECCTNFIHLTVDTRSYNFRFSRKTKILQIINTLFGLFIVANQCSALHGIIYLSGMKTKRRHISGVQYRLSVHLYPKNMSSIINNL